MKMQQDVGQGNVCEISKKRTAFVADETED